MRRMHPGASVLQNAPKIVAMPFLLWNVRGACSPTKKKDIWEHILLLGVSFAAIVETKIKDGNKHTITNLFPAGWHCCSNHDVVDLGRIYLGWNPNAWEVSILDATEQLITAKMCE